MGLPTYTWNAQGICLGLQYGWGNAIWALNAPLNSGSAAQYAGPRSLGAQLRNDSKSHQMEIISTHFRPAYGALLPNSNAPAAVDLARIDDVVGGIPVVGVAHDASYSLPAEIEGRRRGTVVGVSSARRYSPVTSWPTRLPAVAGTQPQMPRGPAISSLISGRPDPVGAQLTPRTIREGEGFAVLMVPGGKDLANTWPVGALWYDITVRNPANGGVWTFTFGEMVAGIGRAESCASIMNRAGSGIVLQVIAVDAWVEGANWTTLMSQWYPTVASYVHCASPIDLDGLIVDDTDNVVPHDSAQPLRSEVSAKLGGIPFQVFDALDWRAMQTMSAIRDGGELSSIGRGRRIQSMWAGATLPMPAPQTTCDLILDGRGGRPAAIVPPGWQFGVGGVPNIGVFATQTAASNPIGATGVWLVGDIETTFQVRPVKGIPRVRAA